MNIKEILKKHALYLQGKPEGKRADLRSADLSRADLSRADLRSADLSRADLRGANLEGAFLSQADLEGANLEGAFLSQADLEGANLIGADLESAFLREADLREANLEGADLSRADLRGADLEGAFLSQADLRGADLIGADLEGATGLVKIMGVEPGNYYWKRFGSDLINYNYQFFVGLNELKEGEVFASDERKTCSFPGFHFASRSWCNIYYNERPYEAKICIPKDAQINEPWVTDGKASADKIEIIQVFDTRTGEDVTEKFRREDDK